MKNEKNFKIKDCNSYFSASLIIGKPVNLKEDFSINNEIILSWSFLQKCEPTEDLINMLVEDEKIMYCYKTVRDFVALTKND